MANEFTKLTEKDIVESVSENGHLFAEDGGKIVRIPAAGIGGGLTIAVVVQGDGGTCSCNKTFDECYSAYMENNLLVIYRIEGEVVFSGSMYYDDSEPSNPFLNVALVNGAHVFIGESGVRVPFE